MNTSSESSCSSVVHDYKRDFKKQLEALTQKNNWNSYLIAENESTLILTDIVGFMREKIKGMGILGEDRAKNSRIKTAAIAFLKNNEPYIERSDFKNIRLLTERIGLTPINEGKDDLRELVNNIKTRILNKIEEQNKVAKQLINLDSTKTPESKVNSFEIEKNTHRDDDTTEGDKQSASEEQSDSLQNDHKLLEEDLATSSFKINSDVITMTSELPKPLKFEPSSKVDLDLSKSRTTDNLVEAISTDQSRSTTSIQVKIPKKINVIKHSEIKDGKWSTVFKIVGLIGLIGLSYLTFQSFGNIPPGGPNVEDGMVRCDVYGPLPFACTKTNNLSYGYLSDGLGNFSECSPNFLKPDFEQDAPNSNFRKKILNDPKSLKTHTEFTEVVISKINKPQEYIDFIKNLNSNDSVEAKKILVWQNNFNEKEYKTDKKKYIKNLFKEISLFIHPDKCIDTLKLDCQQAFIKLQQAAEHLTDAETVSSFESFFQKAQKESNKVQEEINKMTKEELKNLVKNINIKTNTNPNLIHQLFVASNNKENHRLLSKHQIKDLIDTISPYYLYDLFEEEQWIKYLQDLDFSDIHQIEDRIFNILAEKKYLHHLERTQIKAMVKRFGLSFRDRHNGLGRIFLSNEQIKCFAQDLNVQDFQELNLNRNPNIRAIIEDNIRWLSDDVIKLLRKTTGLSFISEKLSKDQFNRYIQSLDETTYENELRDIQTLYRRIHKEEVPASILKAVKNDPMDSLPEYFLGSSELNLDLSSSEYIRKHIPLSVDFIDYVSLTERQRFDFEYTPNGWIRKSGANFDFKEVYHKNIAFTSGYSFSMKGEKTKAWVSLSIRGELEKAVLSIIDGNLVLWQKTTNGQEIIVNNLKDDLSAFNLLKDHEYIQIQGNEIIIPVQKLK